MKRTYSLPALFFISLFVVLFVASDYLFAEDNNLSVTAPTENTDGSQLDDLDSVNFYHSVNTPGGPYDFLTAVAATPGEVVTYLHADQSQGNHCYVATAVDTNGNESDFSNEACKVVDTLAPGTPDGLEVE